MLKINKKALILLFIFLVTGLFGQDRTGYLSVTVEDGMYIYIDTALIGEHSFSYMQWPVGEYTVHVYDPKTIDWSARGISKKIYITEGSYITLSFLDDDQVKILTLPVGGKVFSGDDLLGNTPLTFHRDLVGSKTLKIEKKGYVEESFNLNREQNEYAFQLTPSEEKQKLNIARISSNGQNTLKWYREGLIVTSLIASWTSFYFKRRADETYAKYQRVSDSREMIALFSQTQKYDTYAEIAIGISVATLGTYFYLLLTN